MPDSPIKKGFWRSIRAGLRWVAHVICNPISRGLLWLGGVIGRV